MSVIEARKVVRGACRKVAARLVASPDEMAVELPTRKVPLKKLVVAGCGGSVCADGGGGGAGGEGCGEGGRGGGEGRGGGDAGGEGGAGGGDGAL